MLDAYSAEELWHMDPMIKGHDAQFISNINISPNLAKRLKNTVDKAKTIDSVTVYPGDTPGPNNLIAWMKKDNNQYGYTKENTSYQQTEYINKEVELENLAQQLKLNNYYFILNKLPPGRFLPWHFDTYHRLRQTPLTLGEIKDLKKKNNIRRYIVFLEDWHWGHFLQIGNDVVANWHAGDMYTWDPFRFHLAVNAGIKYRYTLTITGLIT